MNNFKSYWFIEGDSYDYPSLKAAKFAARLAFNKGIPDKYPQKSHIFHVVDTRCVSSVVIEVSPKGRVKFSRPQRL